MSSEARVTGVRVAGVVFVLALAGCLIGGGGGWKTPAAHQRSIARGYAPAELETPGAYKGGEPKHFRARAYVDQGYRSRPHWRAHAENLLRRANGYLRPAFGVALDVQLIEWERRSPGEDLAVIMLELAELDEGVDVDWVIGLVAAPATFTTSHHHLGMAETLGKHMVVRDMNDAAEARQIDQAFDELSDKERRELYGARRAHKELVVFLHEWAHTLGALHERGDGRVMGPSYASEASTFSEANAEVVELGLRIRAVVGDDPKARELRAASEAALLAYVRAAEWDEWFAEEKTELVGLLGGSGGDPALGVAPGERTVRVNLPKAAVRGYNLAVDALRAGDFTAAWSELEPLVAAYPDTPEIQHLGCRLAALGAGGAEAAAACARAARLDPADPRPPTWHAGVLAQAGRAEDDAQVLALLDEAEARLARQSGAEAAEQWFELARVAVGFGALTRAERALTHAGGGADATELAAHVLDTRRLAGLPPDGKRVGVPVEKEPAYYRAFRVAYDKFMATEPRFAREAVHAELARFPAAPGLLALACGVEAAARKAAAARKLCARALAGWDDAVLAHFFAAQAAARPAESIAHYERVIALDPAQRGAWASLGALYDGVGAGDKKRRLQAEYKQRFGTSLPVP